MAHEMAALRYRLPITDIPLPPHAGLQERRYEMKNTFLAQHRELLHWV
jgi:hypothetical protein